MGNRQSVGQPPGGDAPKDLERRPEARSFSIEHLMQLVRDGKVRVPRFQRGLKWEVRDAVALLDSIYRGYPIGTLLFWQRSGEAGLIRYGSVQIAAGDMTDALWVVDGQQRIMSLVRVLLGRGLPEEEFTLFFSPKEHCFYAPKREERVQVDDVPLAEVLDSERLIEWLYNHPQAERRTVIHLGKRIREYQVPAYLVTTEDEDTVREIYKRTNSTGKSMDPGDVFDALYGARGGPASAGLRGVGESLSTLGFGEIDADLLYNMMVATQGTKNVLRKEVPELEPRLAQDAILAIERAARAVITFLVRDAGIPRFELLPYRFPLIPLARFFHLNPSPTQRTRELLARWLWRGALAEEHGGAARLTNPSALKNITADEHRSVQNMLATVSQGPIVPLDLDGFASGTARGKILTLALYSIDPLHLQTGSPIDPTSPEVVESLFPQPIFTAQTAGANIGSLHSLANKIIHPPVEGGLRRLVLAAAGSEDLFFRTKLKSILSSHAISDAALAALNAEDWGGFLVRRAQTLREVVDRFAHKKARYEDSDRPALSSLMVAEHDEAEETDEVSSSRGRE